MTRFSESIETLHRGYLFRSRLAARHSPERQYVIMSTDNAQGKRDYGRVEHPALDELYAALALLSELKAEMQKRIDEANLRVEEAVRALPEVIGDNVR